MTTNAYIFSWDMTGIDAIVPITQYEGIDAENILRILKDEPTERNPLNSILQMMIMRARANSHRHYEIYAIDCAFEINEKEWRTQWESDPQAMADLIRVRGEKIYSDRVDKAIQVIK